MMGKRRQRLFEASVVGSMPRPQFVRDLLDPAIGGRLSQREYNGQMDAAVAYVIATQEMAGVDVITDGEWRRRSYIGVISDLLSGFEMTSRDGRWWHTVVEPLQPRSMGAVAAEIRFVRRHTSRQVKATLPSPYLLGERMWDADRSKAAYRHRRDFTDALVPHLREEVQRVIDAGADVVQFDDPHLCLFVDQRTWEAHADPENELNYAIHMLNEILSGLEAPQSAIHLCRRNKGRSGWVGEGGYEPILPFLKRLNVDQFLMEFTIPVAGDLSVLQTLPATALVGLGCVDCRSDVVDTPETIVDRVERALQYLRPEQVSLNPDCGFAPGSAAEIPLDEAYCKLINEARAAEILRQRYGALFDKAGG
jgi:5-methyltetrahydropteroyltriglutamate--homocysteine methyltransferase